MNHSFFFVTIAFMLTMSLAVGGTLQLNYAIGVALLPKKLSSDATIQSSSGTTLRVVNHVRDTFGGRVKSADFSMVVENLNLSNSMTHKITQTFDFINGSETGTSIQMMSGAFVISQNNRLSKPITQAYNSTFSGDCHRVITSSGTVTGVGTIRLGQASICHIDRTLLPIQ